jgi:hypothetical protein
MTAPVDIRAARLARTGASWIRVRSKLTGRPLALGVPSQSQPGLYHMVDLKSCDCKGFKHYGRCVHLAAAKLYVAQLKAQKGAAA